MIVALCIFAYLLGIVGYAACVQLVTGKSWRGDDPFVEGLNFVGAIVWPLTLVAVVFAGLIVGLLWLGSYAARKLRNQ